MIRATFRTMAIAIAAAAAALFVWPAGTASAGQPPEQLRAAVDRVLRIVEDPALKQRTFERRAAIRAVAGEIFDFTEITRRTLGPNWASATPAQREKLVQLFGSLL